MNKKNKFRGKTLNGGQWVYGSLLQDDYGNCCIVEFVDHHEQWYDVESNSVGQFTGLYDKNGKEIYEGDILDVEGEAVLYVVEWHDAGLKARQVSNRSTIGLSNWNKWISVIGNVHDNPELLKGGEA